MLRFFKAYRAQPRLAMVTSTLYSASSDLFHFLIVFITIFVSYALSGVLLFGRRLKSFSTGMYALTTCFNLVLGEFDWPELAAEQPDQLIDEAMVLEEAEAEGRLSMGNAIKLIGVIKGSVDRIEQKVEVINGKASAAGASKKKAKKKDKHNISK